MTRPIDFTEAGYRRRAYIAWAITGSIGVALILAAVACQRAAMPWFALAFAVTAGSFLNHAAVVLVEYRSEARARRRRALDGGRDG